MVVSLKVGHKSVIIIRSYIYEDVLCLNWGFNINCSVYTKLCVDDGVFSCRP